MKASQWISNKHTFAPGFTHVQTLCKIYAGERLNQSIHYKQKVKVKTEWRSNDGVFGIWCRIFSQRQRETNLLQHADNCIAQRFSKSGLWTRRELNPDQPRLRISSALVSLRPSCVAHTQTHAHTHARGRMNQCCSVYRLFCKTKRIATSNILDKP